MNRWFVVGGAILIQLCLGAIYAWSVFTKKLTIQGAFDGGEGIGPNESVDAYRGAVAEYFGKLFVGLGGGVLVLF